MNIKLKESSDVIKTGASAAQKSARRANIFTNTSLARALPVNPNTAVSFGIGRIGMDRNGSE
jgi:hypothetical protein